MHSSQPLIVRHRPTSFDQVRGNQATIGALQRRVNEAGRPHAYLFSGPSGVGKTTLARIVGNLLNAEILDVDAASNNGVDAMRVLMDLGEYMSATADARMLILDEAHMLSRSSFNAILKTLEEPPPHLYIALCTTEHYRIPETVVNRCHGVDLKKLDNREIEDYLLEIIEKEDWETTADIFQMVVTEADGSPRKALSLLQLCYDAPSLPEAQRIVSLQGSQEPIKQIMHMLITGQGGWGSIQPMLAQLTEDDFDEGTLIWCGRYLIGAMRNPATSENQARRFWDMLSYFVQPARGFDYQAIFYHAIGRILWDEPNDRPSN